MASHLKNLKKNQQVVSTADVDPESRTTPGPLGQIHCPRSSSSAKCRPLEILLDQSQLNQIVLLSGCPLHSTLLISAFNRGWLLDTLF